MPDVIDKIEGCLFQHGKSSNRIYLMKLGDSYIPEVIARLDEMAMVNGYTKIIAKVPRWASSEFEANGYKSEASVPGFYNGSIDVSFMGKYFSTVRECEKDADIILDVLSNACQHRLKGCREKLPEGFEWRIAQESDAHSISNIYRQVFVSYPFPIHDEQYIRETMKDNIIYFCVFRGGELVSAASSEMDFDAQSVEMTDFATLPDYRGHGFAGFLLSKMEDEMCARSIKTAYTIARSVSPGMNITFAKMNYEYAGTLINNTDICGSTESMNVWYKHLCGF
ncbi:putative beta-lysine N-acetyltransferase [bacterium]|nr:putative beta-lysine N-acetyltransferase [bacterium]